MSALDRRELLRLLALAACTPGWLEACARGPAPGPVRAGLAPTQRRWERYARLGRAVRDSGAVERSPRALARTLCESLAWDPETTLTDGGERLLAAVRDDYEEDRLVDVGGWRLALTEARLLALLASGSPA